MQSTGISGRFVLLLMLSLFVGSINIAYADYLIQPVPVVSVNPFAEPVPCPVLRHHAVVKKPRRHYRHYRRHVCSDLVPVPVCVYQYHPQHEPVAFLPGAPSGRGRYVDLSECEPYDPDLTTGDDDPTIYPGMNIDN